MLKLILVYVCAYIVMYIYMYFNKRAILWQANLWSLSNLTSKWNTTHLGLIKTITRKVPKITHNSNNIRTNSGNMIIYVCQSHAVIRILYFKPRETDNPMVVAANFTIFSVCSCKFFVAHWRFSWLRFTIRVCQL